MSVVLMHLFCFGYIPADGRNPFGRSEAANAGVKTARGRVGRNELSN